MNDLSKTMEAEGYGSKKTKTLFTNTDCLHKKPSLNEVVNNLFRKHFSIAKNECYSLPKESTMFKDCVWQINELQKLKTELNSVKNCLNDYDLDKWQMHTKLRNSAKDVMTRLRNNIQPELLTQAWCKFYEIVCSFPLVPVDHIRNNNKRFKSIHLCEAPGAFVTSLNHWLQTNVSDFQWDWIATTLNPYYEGNSLSAMVDDDRFMRHTLNHWYFGEDNTGNLMNVKSLNEFLSIAEPCRDIFLVTADGSMDCSDVPAEQENVLIHLHYCETVAALQLLATGGSFLLKIFTIFECNSICLLYLLSCSFANINLIKPATSKEGNSETYLICTNFKGLEFILPYLEKLKEHYEYGPKNAIFNREDIPCAFIEKVIQCSEFFKSQQCLVIKNNINTFTSDNSKALCDMKQIQRMVADKYIRSYNLKKLESGEIVGNLVILETTTNTNEYNKSLQGSYNERCAKQHLSFLDQIESFCNDTCKVQPYMLSTGDIKYKFHKLPQDLQIRSGKIFQRIYSSKFCSKRLLKILNRVDDILHKMEQKIQFPAVASIDKLEAIVSHKPGHEILVFRYTDTYDSHKIISDIYNVLQELDSGATLVLIGYSLLTHLNIGLLYLVGCTFNSVKITACNDMGLKITLHHYNYNLRVLKFLNEIKATSIEALKQEKAVLEIISPPVLYKGCEDLCSSSEDLNHWVIKTYVQYVLHTLKRSTMSSKSNS